MIRFISENFVPVKIHIKEQPETFKRFGVQWTPTLLVLDPDGIERYRFEGYLPQEEFLAHLQMGLAKSAFAREKWNESEQRYRQIVADYPKTEPASKLFTGPEYQNTRIPEMPAPLPKRLANFKRNTPRVFGPRKRLFGPPRQSLEGCRTHAARLDYAALAHQTCACGRALDLKP